MAWLLLLVVSIALVAVHLGRKADARKAKAAAEASAKAAADLQARNGALAAENESLRVFQGIKDAAAEANRLQMQAQAAVKAAEEEIAALRFTAETEAKTVRADAEAAAEALRREARAANVESQKKAGVLVDDANKKAASILADAETRAEEIAGDAYRALQEADRLKQAATAMRNVVEGYGDRYVIPTYSVLDQMAEDYGFEEAGRELKAAREVAKSLVTSGRAATCDYVEANRRDTAVRFVLDAFNGKVDTILARAKADNIGTLDQQIKDAYALVNHNGAAFRNARITPEYLAGRLQELKWAAAVQVLRDRDREEQRRIRDQIREEEKARREIERALRDAAKEEESLQRAMEKVQAQVAKANDEQKAMFEAQLLDLNARLAEAEARNQRALSMAQQTKAGHVYVISNVGSFGENVLKVGMTRRLEPADRIKELGDASVPFSFDVHAMIWADDAPALERALHKRFVTTQVNKVNPRKEFFRIAVAEVRACVEEMGLNAVWTLAADAAQYRETLAIERALYDNTPAAQEWLKTQMEFVPDMPAEALETESTAA